MPRNHIQTVKAPILGVFVRMSLKVPRRVSGAQWFSVFFFFCFQFLGVLFSKSRGTLLWGPYNKDPTI